MNFSKCFEIFVFGLKYFLIIFAIIIVGIIVLNLFLWMTFCCMSFMKVRARSDSIATNAVLNKEDKRKLKTIGFNIRKEEIGSGYYGTVYKGYHKVSNNNNQRIEAMAIKVIDVKRYQQILRKINEIDMETMKITFDNAIDVLEKISHNNIVKIEKLEKVCDERKDITKLFLFSKIAEINLNDYLTNQKPNGVEDKCARIWFKQICEAVHCLHKVNKVSHQNIKPENILLFTKSKTNETDNEIAFNAKLADTGIASLFPNSAKVCTKKNPIFVISPLETNSNNSSAYDIYTLGVVLIVMLKGNIDKIVPNNKGFALFANFTNRYLEEIEDKQLSELLYGMINPSPHSRIDINAVLSHPWLQKES